MAGERGLAREIRTRLESDLEQPMTDSSQPVNALEELSFNKPVRQHVKEFGALFGIIGYVVASILIYKYGFSLTAGVWVAAGTIFAALGYAAPAVLYPVWKGWMTLAHYLGIFMTSVILTIAWTIVLVPIAMLLRLIGKKVMDTSYGAPVDTYWEERDEKCHDFQLLKRQF